MPLDKCAGGGCVDSSTINIHMLKTTVKAPNNVYWAFTAWDGKCNPIADGKLLEDKFTVKDGGEEQSKLESFNGLIKVPKGAKASIVVLIDTSGSVSDLDKGTVRDSMIEFTELLQRQNEKGAVSIELSVLGFDGRPDPYDVLKEEGVFWDGEGGFFTDMEKARELIYEANFETQDFSTNLNGAVITGIEQLNARDASLKYLIVFTDGTDQASLRTDEAAVAAVTNSKALTFVVALKGEYDEVKLRNLATAGYIPVDGLASLESTFANIASFIQLISGNVFTFLYCSPRRGGTSSVELVMSGTTQSTIEVDTGDFDTMDDDLARCDQDFADTATLQQAGITITEGDLTGAPCYPIRIENASPASASFSRWMAAALALVAVAVGARR